MAEYTCCVAMFWLYLLICCGLVAFAGIMSGLTLGLMSLSIVDLEVLVKAGKPEDQKNAAKILPVVKNHHLLLCTLLIGNALAMEALPIFLDKLLPAWGAILISVTLILAFGEIIPQSVCTRYGLKVGAKMAPLVRVLVVIIFPIAYPISKLLDWILGKDHVMLMRRSELKTLVDMHGNEAGKGGELTHDETTIISGALDLTQKTAKDSMTPIIETFSLDINAKLDMHTMGLIMTKGHSRVPIYSGSPTNVIGLILVKNLITCRSEDEIPIRNVTIRTIPRVYDDLPLYDILNEFQKGHSHMAVVVKRTKEAVDPSENNVQTNQSGKNTPVNGTSPHVIVASSSPINPANSPLGKSNADPARQPMKRGRRSNILDISNADSLPSYSLDEEVVGIITMEDVMEELLQEEILDETDEYVDVHNKIRINMLPPKKVLPRSAGATPVSQVIRKTPSASPFSPNHNNDSNSNNTNGNVLRSPISSPYLQRQNSTPSRTFTPKKSLPTSPARNSLSGQSSPSIQKVSKKPYEKLPKGGDPS
ncbi:CBS domain protein (DUF21) [Rhynchospora pubera]|uniref:CBS domain protein (DUF21) n=1 Tax=Rhynchospora pubera TaxID=906938 RepID=A0AAV8E0S2_9POAL|nr:CBS domain protein (DUF21) [Rhynchospora pubera]